MGQKKYNKTVLHPIRHMNDYVAEIEAGSVSPYRTQQLKERFRKVKETAFSMYKDAFNLISELDGEGKRDVNFYWKKDIGFISIYSGGGCHKFADYSKIALHPVRHLTEYFTEIECQDVSVERMYTIKERLANVLILSVQLYFDAEILLRMLDGE